MSEHQAACLQLLSQRSMLRTEYRSHRNIMAEQGPGAKRYWESDSVARYLKKEIRRMNRIINAK